MKIDLDELERKATAATPGLWRWGRPDDNDPSMTVQRHHLLTIEHRHVITLDAMSQWGTLADDTEHIAANSPPVTLALIARIRQLETAFGEALDGNTWPDRSVRHRALLAKGTVLP